MKDLWKKKAAELLHLLKRDYRETGNISALGVEGYCKLKEAEERV